MGTFFSSVDKKPNEAIIKCNVSKNCFKYDKYVPEKFVDRIDEKTFQEFIQHIDDAISAMDSSELKTVSKKYRNYSLVCIIVFIFCCPSSITAFIGGISNNYHLYWIGAGILFMISCISLILFIKYSTNKIQCDNIWRIKIYKGIVNRLQVLNNHFALKNFISFQLKHQWSSKKYKSSLNCFECGACIGKNICSFCSKCCNTYNDNIRFTNKYPIIVIRLKSAKLILQKGVVYQDINGNDKQNANNSMNEPLLSNNYDNLVPSAPVVEPASNEYGSVQQSQPVPPAYNPELIEGEGNI